jgi:hypothetical protein
LVKKRGNSNLFLFVFSLIAFSLFVTSLVSAQTTDCYQYDSVNGGCNSTNGCFFQNDSWGSWCETLGCWNLETQTDCSVASFGGSNCTWSGGNSWNYCSEISCYSYSGTDNSTCESNTKGLSCSWSSSCYSDGGTGCYDITNQNTCGNTTGCKWGSCQTKSCYDVSSEAACNAALDPWQHTNCTWISLGGAAASCQSDQCSSLYLNETSCNTKSHCKWYSGGWCGSFTCSNFNDQNSCDDANTTHNKDCFWDTSSGSSWCAEDNCWRYDGDQNECNGRSDCAWTTSTSSGWCEEVRCWTWDSWNGATEADCNGNSTAYGLNCKWYNFSGGGGGWCETDYSVTSCVNVTTEKACYDTYYCWWQATDWTNSSKGGNCTEPTWGSGDYANYSDDITNDWNPGCYIFDQNGTQCNNTIGCTHDGVGCNEILSGDNSAQGLNITHDGISCTFLNESELCNNIPVLSTCCNWLNGTCSATRSVNTCWNSLSQTPNGEESCEDATSQTACDQISGTPWYWPCKWDNSTSINKCVVKADDIWGNRTRNLVTVENRITCEAVGGKWVTENYCEGDVAVPAGRCENKFDEEKNCNKACYACEYKSDGSAHDSLQDAKDACTGSNLGYCEFDEDTTASNGFGFCEAKDEFKKGVAGDCDSDCGACTFLGEPNGVNGTKTPEDWCKSSRANTAGGGCEWRVNNETSTGGFCIEEGELLCEDSCDRCDERTLCVNRGRVDITNGTVGSCKWQGTDNDGSCVANIAGEVEICWNGEDDDDDTLTDCADPSCYSDSFCGFVEGDCYNWKNDTNCNSNGCEWINDTWNPNGWCDFAGSHCWRYDGSEISCRGITNITEVLDISAARMLNNDINESHTFSLTYNEAGWVTGSISIINESGADISGNFSVNINTRKINFTNSSFMIDDGGLGNLTNVTYQYYASTGGNCKWQNGTGSGWCEQDWSIAEICFTANNETECNTLSGSSCSWTNDTWCDGTGSTSDWCDTTGGWCDHSSFASNDCWQNYDNSTCTSTSGCSWRIDEWSSEFCEVNWSGNCWSQSAQAGCEGVSGCTWKTDSWGSWCTNKFDLCWQQSNQSDCNSFTTASCAWKTYGGGGGSCEPSCYNQTTSDSCSGISGCSWRSDSGWCEEESHGACSNATSYENQVNCEAISGCDWRGSGWCNPKDGFSTGVGGGGGVGGSTGGECYKYDGNKTKCTDTAGTFHNLTCGWFPESNPYCDTDWSTDCWEYESEAAGCTTANGCWWNPEFNWCGNVMDQCWNNATLQSSQSACDDHASCNYTGYSCEPSCYSSTTEGTCLDVTGCRWINGWCNAGGVNELFDNVEEGTPVPLGFDTCDGSETTQASVDICAFGMKDMDDAYGFGANVLDFTNASVCNKEKVGQVVGSGNETIKSIVYLDTDGSESGGCTLVNNGSAEGYEFRLRYSSEWNQNTSKVSEAFTAYKCSNSKWKLTDIKISTWRKFMCGDIRGPLIAVEKGELSRFPTLYDSTADMRVYVATIGATGNVTNPSDTAGPGYATPGAIDFEIFSAFEHGADAAKYEDILKKGYVQGEDCFTAADDDNDGKTNCDDWDCQFSSVCSTGGVNAAGYVDTSTPQVTGVKIEEYTDSALILYDTNKPANGTLLFYNNDSTCATLNASVYDTGVTSNNVRHYRLSHKAEVFSDNIGGYDLVNDTTYYYKLDVCDDNGKCARSRCTSFVTAPQTRCGFCNFVTKLKVPTGWTVSYDADQSGTYEHVQGQVCGPNAGMKTNYTTGRHVDILLNNSDGSVYFKFLNASLTKTALNDKVRTISGSDALIASSIIAGLSSSTRDKIINNLNPEVCQVKVPYEGTCDTIFHCDDTGGGCIDRTSSSTLIDATECLWQISNCEFSTYRESLESSGSGSPGGGGGGGSSSSSSSTTTPKTTPQDEEEETETSPPSEEQPSESDKTSPPRTLPTTKAGGIGFTLILGILIVLAVVGAYLGLRYKKNRRSHGSIRDFAKSFGR